ncbi:hypothetical protein CDD81_4688 [Ophiocordyceps australis]|uniref:Uncharacterized protein n=1 Tax=Ophiocordyceps australis TaxID=1399860 RepID=A0A2C5YBT1_9HYPO|nr:hypothetical protein CDD81_4688 [Ophiocordyceps australis]
MVIRFRFSSADVEQRISSLQARIILVPPKQGEQYPKIRVLAPHEINADAVSAGISTDEKQKMDMSIEQPSLHIPLVRGGVWKESSKKVDYLDTFLRQ